MSTGDISRISYIHFSNLSPVTLPHWSFKDRHQMAGDITRLYNEFQRMPPDGRRLHNAEISLMEVHQHK